MEEEDKEIFHHIKLRFETQVIVVDKILSTTPKLSELKRKTYSTGPKCKIFEKIMGLGADPENEPHFMKETFNTRLGTYLKQEEKGNTRSNSRCSERSGSCRANCTDSGLPAHPSETQAKPKREPSKTDRILEEINSKWLRELESNVLSEKPNARNQEKSKASNLETRSESQKEMKNCVPKAPASTTSNGTKKMTNHSVSLRNEEEISSSPEESSLHKDIKNIKDICLDLKERLATHGHKEIENEMDELKRENRKLTQEVKILKHENSEILSQLLQMSKSIAFLIILNLFLVIFAMKSCFCFQRNSPYSHFFGFLGF